MPIEAETMDAMESVLDAMESSLAMRVVVVRLLDLDLLGFFFVFNVAQDSLSSHKFSVDPTSGYLAFFDDFLLGSFLTSCWPVVWW